MIILSMINIVLAGTIFSNTNTTIDDGNINNINIIRVDGKEDINNYYIKYIIDGVRVNRNARGYKTANVPIKTNTKIKDDKMFIELHRLNIGWEDDKQDIRLGLQSMPMGVGHIWSPINIYNGELMKTLPLNLKTKGVYGLSYDYALGKLSNMKLIISQDKAGKRKYGGILKSFNGWADIGLDWIISKGEYMVGFETEANLYQTGMVVRGELATFNLETAYRNIYQGMIGADYGFRNGLNVTIEGYLDNNKQNYEYIPNIGSEIIITPNIVESSANLGLSLNYLFNMDLSGDLLITKSIRGSDNRLINSKLNYSINDNNNISIGATRMILGELKKNNIYLSWDLTF
jgi:hypothetical protein